MNKEVYQKMNESICPDRTLTTRVLERIQRRNGHYWRPAIAFALTIVLVLCAPMALASPDIYALVQGITPALAARLAPVQESCEADGIRMEVAAAAVSAEGAEVYLVFEDLSESRLGNHVSLDCVSIEGSFFDTASMSGGYDESTGKYTALVTMQMQSGEDIRKVVGEKITVYVEQLSRAAEEICEVIPTEILQHDVSTYLHGSEAVIEAEAPLYVISDTLEITGMAFVDGRLLVQVRGKTLPGYTVPEFMVYLRDAYGGERAWDHAAVFSYGENDDELHVAYYFDILPDELVNYQVLLEGKTRLCIEGPWRVTFELDQVESDYTGPLDEPLDKGK